jgi:ferrochelatase
MMRYSPEPPPVADPPAAGILLANRGSPTAPAARAVRAFLREVLADPRVVETPRLQWWLLRNLVILPFRPLRDARAYRKIWTDEGPPSVVTCRGQAADLEWEIGRRIDRPLPVFAGMRYGRPSIAAALDVLRRRGCQRILVLPLYPQYSTTTTASVFDLVMRELASWRRVPELRTIAGYHDHPAYIGALASILQRAWQSGGKPRRLLLSYPGIPLRSADAGDPYPDQCRQSSSVLASHLDIEPKTIVTAFQPRLGGEPLIEPNTTDLLRTWGKEHIDRLDVMCPGFAADCFETLAQIDVAGRRSFEKAGGGSFRYVPALNRRPEHIAALAEIAIEHLMGWVV